MIWLLPKIVVLAAFIDNMVNVVVSTPKNERQQSVKRASIECQESINRASTNFGVESHVIGGLWYGINP